jgi:anti-sigma regulatory factor (Ser/Thr protein kinase)
LSSAAYEAELSIPGDFIYLRPVRLFIRELAENIGFCHDRVNDIQLVVDEILSNVIEHGSDGYVSRIRISCLSTDDMIEVVVSDTGRSGGSSTKLAKAWSDAVEDRSKTGTERGHGLLLAHNLTDEISMQANSVGGVNVHMVMYKEEQRVKRR